MPCVANKQNRAHTARTYVIYMVWTGLEPCFCMQVPTGTLQLQISWPTLRVTVSLAAGTSLGASAATPHEGPDQSHGPGQPTTPASQHPRRRRTRCKRLMQACRSCVQSPSIQGIRWNQLSALPVLSTRCPVA